MLSLALLLSALLAGSGWNYSVTECIDANGQPVRSLHEGQHFAVLGSGFGTSGSLVLGWSPDAVLAWTDTRVDAVAGPVAPGMHAGLSPLVVHHADGTLSLSPFPVELVSNTVRSPEPAGARPVTARVSLDGKEYQARGLLTLAPGPDFGHWVITGEQSLVSVP
jgi:hypothetical protein